MTVEISCVGFLNAVAFQLSNLYDFELRNCRHPTFEDVLRAKESKTWSHRKFPRTEQRLDEVFEDHQWMALRKLDCIVADRPREAQMPREIKTGGQFVTLPQNKFNYWSRKYLQQAAERIGLDDVAFRPKA